MTREEKLWSMTARTLQEVGEKAGVKITNSDIKKGKAVIIEKILAAEANESNEILKEKMNDRNNKLVPMPGTEDPNWGKKHYSDQNDEVAIVMQQKKDLGIECPKIDPEKVEIVSETPAKPERKRGALIEYNGKSQNICAWAKELGVSANTLYSRIYILGWDVEKAFTHKGKKS